MCKIIVKSENQLYTQEIPGYFVTLLFPLHKNGRAQLSISHVTIPRYKFGAKSTFRRKQETFYEGKLVKIL